MRVTNPRPLHWLAGLFAGYLIWINPIAAILLCALFVVEQITNEYAEPNPMDFDRDVWDFEIATFVGVGIGFIIKLI